MALILREIEAALAEGRAYAGNRPIVRALRVITENDIQQFADGKSYFVARVKVSHDAVFLPGDLIFAVDGFLMAPGWDVSAILNRRHARTFYRTVDLIRAGRVLKVLPTVTLVFPTEEEIAKRRFQGAIERLLLDELVAQGVITNPAWR
ncbi:MAG: hypothetical protein N2039_03170 [Gemmataceae bacterium]|nr:hypothetical protein [Gemmataceae bacterium]